MWRSVKKEKGHNAELLAWSVGVVRFELTLRYPELEALQPRLVARAPSPARATSWAASLTEIWQSYYDRITWNENTSMKNSTDLLEASLTTGQRKTLALWRLGQDLRSMVSRPTFYRHRLALLAAVGVDIATPPVAKKETAETPALTPAGWDPEPIASRLVEPRAGLKEQYKLA
jgi:II/X family phage/plasmid replication protein